MERKIVAQQLHEALYSIDGELRPPDRGHFASKQFLVAFDVKIYTWIATCSVKGEAAMFVLSPQAN
ncbi:hypothetical protein PHMEG_00035957 [Phytophthora megakarya]|uniref:Uncharacterized protein n=1 Tax=Phytophthora megakarya TaxID=4795 RepID=A0A225UMY0_9STRA|nr:hypothetical protein PHMEG_00035957 [Phytophthora megakarya]